MLYKVVVRPNAYPDTLSDGMCLDEFRLRDRWHGTREDAEAACRKACGLIGPRPRPGIQHQRPIPIAVFEVRFADALAAVRRDWAIFHEISRLWQFYDGSVRTDPGPKGGAQEPCPGVLFGDDRRVPCGAQVAIDGLCTRCWPSVHAPSQRS